MLLLKKLASSVVYLQTVKKNNRLCKLTQGAKISAPWCKDTGHVTIEHHLTNLLFFLYSSFFCPLVPCWFTSTVSSTPGKSQNFRVVFYCIRHPTSFLRSLHCLSLSLGETRVAAGHLSTQNLSSKKICWGGVA